MYREKNYFCTYRYLGKILTHGAAYKVGCLRSQLDTVPLEPVGSSQNSLHRAQAEPLRPTDMAPQATPIPTYCHRKYSAHAFY